MAEEEKIIYLNRNDWRLQKVGDAIREAIFDLPDDARLATAIGIMEIIKYELIRDSKEEDE